MGVQSTETPGEDNVERFRLGSPVGGVPILKIENIRRGPVKECG